MVKVLKKKKSEKRDSTDINLLVSSASQEITEEFNRDRVIDCLEEEASIDRRVGGKVAKAVESLLIKSEAKTVTSTLIRELIDNVLLEMGLGRKLQKQNILGIPKADIEELIFSKTLENSNIAANNPEAISFTISETILKQYALQEVFSKELRDFHFSGAGHIHDIGFCTRLYCSSHPLAYLCKYGLDGIDNLFTSSFPANRAATLIGHLNTFLSVMQAYWAGALGIGFMNVFFAPYLKGKTYEEIKQDVQYLIYSSSQNAYSRGGQSLFLDYGITFNIPEFFKETDAIGPGGKILGKYKDYEEEAYMFTKAFIEVIMAGDKYGRPFAFPKMMLSINEETFTDKRSNELFQLACKSAAKDGSPYFTFSRKDGETKLSQCCRLSFQIDDRSVFKNPEKLRFFGFQNVTINLPQAAYRGKGKLDKTIEEIEWAMDMAMKAHLQKKDFISRLMSKQGYPLWQVGKNWADGWPYVDLEKAVYIIGMLGLNECVKRISGKELHEDEDTLKLGLKIMSAMYLKAKKLSAEHKLKVNLEESPAESTAYRLARVDCMNYPEAREYVLGDTEKMNNVFYTNSVHLRASAAVNIFERIEKQAKFSPLLEAGSITHVFLGEQKVSPEAIASLVEKTFRNTKAAQIVISPELTACKDCNSITQGIHIKEEK